MENLEKILKNKKIIVIAICIIILIGIGAYLYLSNNQYENFNSIKTLEEMENGMQKNQIDKENQNNMNENVSENLENTNNNEIQEETKIAIHITGEVKKKGILYLDKGARIVDAIEAAGGATKNASLDQVNLAYILEDGQKIYIPNKNEKIETGAYIITNSGQNVLIEEGKESTTTEKNAKGVSGKVNINTANQTELETLQGIGPALAQRIIEYRQENGKFQTIEDIQNVKGIGDSKYSNIKDDICI